MAVREARFVAVSAVVGGTASDQRVGPSIEAAIHVYRTVAAGALPREIDVDRALALASAEGVETETIWRAYAIGATGKRFEADSEGGSPISIGGIGADGIVEIAVCVGGSRSASIRS